MTPAARISAAISVLDLVLAGMPAEQALTNWGRGSRYAGSGDRAGVRDHVFAALRCKRSFAARGGAETGRGLMIGGLQATDIEGLFTGVGHAPAALTLQEAAHLAQAHTVPDLVALDCPDWLAPQLRSSLGGDFAAVMAALQHRAPVFLRVNLRFGTRADAVAALAAEGVTCRPHDLAKTALEVTDNARKVQSSQAYAMGLVEVQDAASQAILASLPAEGLRVLDYCAGGGGKALALADRGARVWAHDADPRRMRDLPARAERAGVVIKALQTAEIKQHSPFDLVFLDVPCTGSGSWRRAPEAKWALSQARLDALLRIQAEILDIASGYVARAGHLAYATCSLLDAENAQQVEDFLGRTPGWRNVSHRRLTPLDGGDGFYVAHLTRE